MITPLQIYLISIADKVRDILPPVFFFVILGFIMSLIGFLLQIADDDDGKLGKAFKNMTITSFILLIVTLFLAVFIPSTKSLIAIYTIPPIVNNKEVQKLPGNLLRFANDYLEKLNKEEEK